MRKEDKTMQLSRTLGGCCDIIHGKEFPMNSVVLRLDNGITLICTNFHQSRKKPLKVHCYIIAEKKWGFAFLKGEYKEVMWDYYRKCEHKNKQKSFKGNYTSLMRHDRKHKKSSGGSKNSRPGTVTDYECAKNPMHDFRRVYN